MQNQLALVNATNIHVGGGVQVAISFLYELTILYDSLPSIHVVVSNEVSEGLNSLSADNSVFGSYEIIDTFGSKAFYSKLNNRIKNYKVVFTVFGPNYLRAKAQNEIVGFAQLWILGFDNPISRSMSTLKRNKLLVKLYIQWLFFLRSDHYIVELEHVKKSLIEHKGLKGSEISVVYNTVSSLYMNEEKWKPVFIKKKQGSIALGMVTRDYPHKNIGLFPNLAEILERVHNLRVHFYVTLNDDEWSNKDEYFRKYVSTVGSLTPNQCPSFYQQMDAVVFPSLLECFSATPLEAMVMKKPLFASDRGFVRDVCGEHAVYIDPLDPSDIAFKIASYFKSVTDYSLSLAKAREHALQFSSAQGRAEKYLEVINRYLEK